jgi:membrane-associated phospholipid phosphatase
LFQGLYWKNKATWFTIYTLMTGNSPSSRSQEPGFHLRRQAAILVTNILSPFTIGLVLILLLSSRATTNLGDAVKWCLILIALSLLPTFLFVIYLVRNRKLDGIFGNTRQQRMYIYIMVVILGALSCGILYLLHAPVLLLALAVVGFTAIFTYMCVNLFWKISLHTAFITGAAALLFILYGLVSLACIALIPLVAWARMELNQHTLAQVIAGGLLSVIIVLAIFYLFGLVP